MLNVQKNAFPETNWCVFKKHRFIIVEEHYPQAASTSFQCNRARVITAAKDKEVVIFVNIVLGEGNLHPVLDAL